VLKQVVHVVTIGLESVKVLILYHNFLEELRKPRNISVRILDARFEIRGGSRNYNYCFVVFVSFVRNMKSMEKKRNV
jgi:hypothetical protein